MPDTKPATEEISDLENALICSGCVLPEAFGNRLDLRPDSHLSVSRIESALHAEEEAQQELHRVSQFLREEVVDRVLDMDRWIDDPKDIELLGEFLARLIRAVDEFRTEPSFVAIYADLLAVYLYVLYRCGAPGRESPIIRTILANTSRRKAVELNRRELEDRIRGLERTVTVAIVTKRYAAYALATRGVTVLFRSEISYRDHGKSPEGLALQIANQLRESGVKLSEVSDVICAGGDLGTLPDGIYTLNDRVRDESRKRLGASSLNLGALVACALKEVAAKEGRNEAVHVSLVSPLSFTTLDPRESSLFLKAEKADLTKSIKGYVKATPLKALAALLSELLGIGQDRLNLLVMSLDELFASVARKIGPRIERELAVQDANEILGRFDFTKIVEALRREGFSIPPNFRLASSEIGTGVKEICELIMIAESGEISHALASSLKQVVDAYARRVASLLEAASSGTKSQRPHFMAIASMLALDPHFQKLFAKVRNRMPNAFTPIMCVDSLELEYMIARQLFEMYVNPEARDTRLYYAMETVSVRKALQVLGAATPDGKVFSFDALVEEITQSFSDGSLCKGNLVLVGADNEDALAAVVEAREYGLLDKLVLIGDPDGIRMAAEECRVSLEGGDGQPIIILPTDPLAADDKAKKESLADVFEDFLRNNSDFFVMKGSLSTGPLLRKALSIYRPKEAKGEANHHKMASHTALFVLPDGRFFALSDAAVNPSFSNPETLLKAIENQLDVVRSIVGRESPLKVAIVTAVEKRTSAIPATHLAGRAMELSGELEATYGPVVVEGPLSFDLATVPEVAHEKHYEGRIMGDANCMVATEINTANVIYKMLSKTMGSLGLMIDSGGIITAGPGTVPIVLTSRGDTAKTKFNSILLGLKYCSVNRCQQSG